MVSVQIAEMERKLDAVDAEWVCQQVDRRQHEGLPVCVQVTVFTSDLNVILSTPACHAGGGGRHPNKHEQEVLNLWTKCGLNQVGFTSRQVLTFLGQLKALV
jgi:hypothetical protein